MKRIDIWVALVAVCIAAWLMVSLFVPLPGNESTSPTVARAVAAPTPPPGVKADWLDGDADERERVKDIENSRRRCRSRTGPTAKRRRWTNSRARSCCSTSGATWSAPCLAAVPSNNELQAKYAEKGLVILGFLADPAVRQTAQTMKDRGFKYPSARDTDSKTATAYKVESLPTYHLVDRAVVLGLRGRVQAREAREAIGTAAGEPGGEQMTNDETRMTNQTNDEARMSGSASSFGLRH